MRFLMVVLILITASAHSPAQVKMDDSNIKRLQDGQFSFAKGEVQVTFSDTVSPDFVREQLNILGYEILNLNVQPIFAWIQNTPDEEQLRALEKDSRVNRIVVEQRGISEIALYEMFERDSLSQEEQKEAMERFRAMEDQKIVRLFFNYNVDEQAARTFINEYQDIDFRLDMVSPKTAIVKTEVEKEAEAMEALELLVYIKSTAYIGIIDEE